MQRGMSYRKPVPIYIPSPPASPALLAIQLPHSLENDPVWTPLQGEDSICISNTAVNGAPTLTPTDNKVPSLPVKSPKGEQIPIDDSNCPPLMAPPCPPPGRRVKRKLHQHYRPPTPPLPSQSRKYKYRTPDTVAVVETPSSSVFRGDCESPYPELRRKSSTVAPSFTTSHTQSPSFQTEKTYISFDRCMFWPKKCNVRLHQFDSRSGLPVGHETEGEGEVSWWGKIGSWGALIGCKAKRFANMYMC